MSELKTLKDIECLDADHPLYCKDDFGHTYSQGNIKQEAIKLFLSKYNKDGNTIEDKDWFDFFNITQEELKDASGRKGE